MKFTDRLVPSAQTKTILIVDDEAPIRLLLSCVLNQAGYKVIVAVDGIDAANRMAKDIHIDLLLTDVSMPGMNGIKLATLFRQFRPGVPVLYVSGMLDSFPEACAGLHTVAKPFTPGELLDAVWAALSSANPLNASPMTSLPASRLLSHV